MSSVDSAGYSGMDAGARWRPLGNDETPRRHQSRMRSECCGVSR
jgi:hypothetical protein